MRDPLLPNELYERGKLRAQMMGDSSFNTQNRDAFSNGTNEGGKGLFGNHGFAVGEGRREGNERSVRIQNARARLGRVGKTNKHSVSTEGLKPAAEDQGEEYEVKEWICAGFDD